MIPGLGDILHRIGDGGGAGGGGQGRRAPLQGGDPLLKHIGGGIHQAGVDVPLLRQAEAGRGLIAVLEPIGGGHVNRHGAGVGGRIGLLLPGVQLQRFEFPIIFAHKYPPFIRTKAHISAQNTRFPLRRPYGFRIKAHGFARRLRR